MYKLIAAENEYRKEHRRKKNGTNNKIEQKSHLSDICTTEKGKRGLKSKEAGFFTVGIIPGYNQVDTAV